MKKLMHFMFLSCLKATELIEKKLHFTLSIKEKLQLKVHKSMCEACSNYEKQSFLIDKALADQGKADGQNPDFDLSSFKKSIHDKMEFNKK